MANRMLQFVRLPQQRPEKREAAERRGDFREIYADFDAALRTRAVQPLQPVRRAVLPGALPAAEQHPGLAEADRRRPARGSLRGQQRHQQLPRNLRPHLPAGPAVRRQLRHREGLRERHHRRGRALHHRHRLRTRLGQAAASRAPRTRLSVGIVGAGPGGLAAAEQLRRQGYAVARLRPLRPRRRPDDLRHPQLQAGKAHRRAPAAGCWSEAGIVFHLDTDVGRDVTPRRAARAATTRCCSPPASTRRASSAAPAPGCPASCPALDYLTASNRKGLGDAVPAFDDGALDAAGKRRRGDRRRRHRHGLRAHRGAPGRALGEVPLPPRPRQHAGLHARGAQRRGGGRRVRLAVGAGGLPRRRPRERRARRCAMHLGLPDASGRQSVEPIEGSHFTVPATWSSRRSASTPRTCRPPSASPRSR